MAERLGEVPEELPLDRVDLLEQETDVVDEGGGPFEDLAGPVGLSGSGQGLGQPGGAQQERSGRALLGRRPVSLNPRESHGSTARG